jgi:hypothetical protein
MNFALTRTSHHYISKSEDTFFVSKDSDSIIQVMCMVKIDMFDETKSTYDIHQTTDNNMTVLKLLYKNSKGYYYQSKLSKGYGSKTQRVFLTKEEQVQLEEYLKNY